MPRVDRPRCKSCKRVGSPDELETWGRRRNGWLKQLCPTCEAARIASHKCIHCGRSASGVDDWPRQENGALNALCPACTALWQAKRDSYACAHCGITIAKCPEWGRYQNGRLKSLCPTCDASPDRLQAQARKREAATTGYRRGWSSTPAYRRISREREAAREGRELTAYIPQAERERSGRMLSVEQRAEALRRSWARKMLADFRKFDREAFREFYRTDFEFREQQKAKYRDYYRRHRHAEVARGSRYKREKC